MQLGMLIFALAFAVSSSENQVPGCPERYAIDCAVPLINAWGTSNDRICRVALPFTRCIANVSADCDEKYSPILEKAAHLLYNVCYINEAEKQELQDAAQCVANNSHSLEKCAENLPEDVCNASISILQCAQSELKECGDVVKKIMDKLIFLVEWLYGPCSYSDRTDLAEIKQCLMDNATTILSCKVPGEFNTVGDICRYVGDFRQCIVSESKRVCGDEAGQLVEISTKYVAFVMDLCTNLREINALPLQECEKAVLKCRADVPLFGQKCTDIPKHLDCLAKATKQCTEIVNPLYAVLLINYKNKFPVYCNQDSAFNKNLQTQGKCILRESSGVTRICGVKLQNDIGEIKKGDQVGRQRSIVNFLNCLRGGYGDKCTKQAADAVNDLLHPLGDTLDESCMLLTGKRCNNACGLQVATWMLIAAVVYLLTRKY